MSTLEIIYLVSALIAGSALGFWFRKYQSQKKLENLDEIIEEKLKKSETEATKILTEAADKARKILTETEEEIKTERADLNKTRERLLNREVLLDEKSKRLEEKEEKLNSEIEKLKQAKEEIEKYRLAQFQKLEEISKLTAEQAKDILFEELKKRYETDLFESLRKLEKLRKEEIEKKSAQLMLDIIQRYSRSSVSEFTTSTVNIPNEEIKGKIIGKEGRNIKAFENLTGVEIIIDETPDAVTLSCFDPVRRAVAKLALEKLITDSRIQPAKIEEKVAEAHKEINQAIKEAGEQAVYELGIIDLPAEIVQLLGRLNYRTSYGQNVLTHSIEVAYFAEMLANELNLDSEIAKKAGLLHDIGKAIDHEVEGDHLNLGIKILQKYKIDEKVILAMRSHHENYPIAIPEAYLVNAADALSASRPGARRESLESYLKRLTDLEKIAKEFKGVEKSYAISAGRELRVFVIPQEISDLEMMDLARSIALKIEEELKYAGEIKVVVIRENRAIEYAK